MGEKGKQIPLDLDEMRTFFGRNVADRLWRRNEQHQPLIDALERTVQVLEIAAVFVRDDCGRKETAQGFFSNAKVARAVLDRARKGEGSCQSQQP